MGKRLSEFPVRLLRSISDGLEWLFAKLISPMGRSEDDDDDERRRRWWHWFWLLPALVVYWLYHIGLATITFPIRAWFLPRNQRNSYLRGLPAMLAAIAVVVSVAAYFFLQDRIMIRYAAKAYNGLSQNQPAIGKRCVIRAVTESRERRQENAYLLAMLLARTDDVQVANQVLATIAPDDTIGYAPAHELRAFELVQQLANNPDEETIEKLRWHLEQSSNDKTERMLAAWARYHQATGELATAASELKQAGQINPLYYLTLWELEQRRGNAKEAANALEDAREGFAEQLTQAPLSKLTRLQLALTLTKQNRMQDAERVLLAGLQLHRDSDMQKAVADFYVLRFDATSDSTPVIERLGLLTRALSADLNNRAIYDRLTQLFRQDLTVEERQNFRGRLEELLVSGANPAIAHFGLGFLNLIDSDKKEQGAWHLKQAITLQPVIALACNNLGTVLMQQEPPRLDEALELSRQAVAASPKTGPFHETLGSVLLARQEWAEAANELKIALELSNNPKLIHAQLAEAFEGLGQKTDAERHRELAD